VRYELNGLVVECDVVIRGAHPAPDASAPDLLITHVGERDVPAEIVEGRVLQEARVGDRLLYSTVERPGGAVVLRLHGTADFEISPDRRTVRAWSDPRCRPEMLAILAAGNLLATVLGLRGETVLHASAVEREGSAVAFVAHSGMGKSTLAALACMQGARFVTDDLLRLSYADGGVRCLRGSRENRLRRDVAELSESGADASTRTSVDGRVVWAPPESPWSSSVLRAVVLPELTRDHDHLELQLLSPGKAVVELTRHPRILGWCDPDVLRSTFANLAALVREVPVFRAGIPWGPPFAPEMVEELLRRVGLPAAPVPAVDRLNAGVAAQTGSTRSTWSSSPLSVVR
jgi:hypothetical protein